MEIIHEIYYYDKEKKKKSIEIWGYYNKNGVFIYHNELNKPSYITYKDDGTTSLIIYRQYGKRHRTNGPAYIYFNSNTLSIEYHFLNGKEVMELKHVKDINDLILG